MSQNKKASAWAKAIEDNQQLTTKFCCGECNKAITGVGGTSHTGAFDQYNCASTRRKNGYKNKAVRRACIEDVVINRLIRENEKATANLIPALESGKAVDIISAQIEKRPH